MSGIPTRQTFVGVRENVENRSREATGTQSYGELRLDMKKMKKKSLDKS